MIDVSWICGLSLIALTVAIHATGVVMMALAGFRIRVRLQAGALGLRHAIPLLICMVGAAGLLLAVLHATEAGIWAAAYLWVGALDSSGEAILYSLDSITTRGASGLVLQPNWQLMGALESADGMLLFGLSTAFLFAVMQVYWPILSEMVAKRHARR